MAQWGSVDRGNGVTLTFRPPSDDRGDTAAAPQGVAPKEVTAFDTGSVRDTSAGKGAFELIPGDGLAAAADYLASRDEFGVSRARDIFDYDDDALVDEILQAVWSEPSQPLYSLTDEMARAAVAALVLLTPEGERAKYAGREYPLTMLPYDGLHAAGLLYEHGARDYLPRNWELGQNYGRVMASLRRHASKLSAGFTDENHAAAVAWNALALLTYEARVMGPVLDDWTKRDIKGGKA